VKDLLVSISEINLVDVKLLFPKSDNNNKLATVSDAIIFDKNTLLCIEYDNLTESDSDFLVKIPKYIQWFKSQEMSDFVQKKIAFVFRDMDTPFVKGEVPPLKKEPLSRINRLIEKAGQVMTFSGSNAMQWFNESRSAEMYFLLDRDFIRYGSEIFKESKKDVDHYLKTNQSGQLEEIVEEQLVLFE
jgi:hypothetical protein